MKEYVINKETLIIISINEKQSKIIEQNDEFIINKHTTKIIDESCKYFGSSYDGRLKGTKNILGVSVKAPIILEESSQIIFFPTTSPRNNKCSWISLSNIETYEKGNNKTTILKFYCGKIVKINIPYQIIDNQILRATRLDSLLKKRKEKI